MDQIFRKIRFSDTYHLVAILTLALALFLVGSILWRLSLFSGFNEFDCISCRWENNKMFALVSDVRASNLWSCPIVSDSVEELNFGAPDICN